MRDKIKVFFPPGYEYETACKRQLIMLAAAVVYSFRFFFQYYDARKQLYEWVFQRPGVSIRVLREGAQIASFAEVVEFSFLLFVPLLLVFWVEIIEHYLYYKSGSKSIYLIKRLPHKWFFWKTCVIGPLLGMVFTGVIIGILLLLYYGVYICFTPAGCLP